MSVNRDASLRDAGMGVGVNVDKEAPAFAGDANAPAVRIVDYSRMPPERWANGDGTTRTLARGPEQNGAATWRLSVATLDGAAKFSQFPGYDRTLLLIDDGAIDLLSQDGKLLARAGQPVHFSGELPVWIDLPVRPVNVLNFMHQRGAHRVRVSVDTHSLRVTPAATHLFVSLAGQWDVQSAVLRDVTLPPLNALWTSGRSDDLVLRPTAPGAQLVSIAIDADTSNTTDTTGMEGHSR
ncbi:HutD family protein [Paraburkholderia xenovorans]|uniref:HutD/Ves family protein n=1 Tax=Paraburkholderia xenovorans TaxID=36873 RepID=UPI0038BA8BEC